MYFDPLLHRLILDHDIIFCDNIEKKFKKNVSIVLNTFERSICSKELFHNIFKYIVFQRPYHRVKG